MLQQSHAWSKQPNILSQSSVVIIVDGRSQLVFLLLILAQAAHSVEEYTNRLYDVLAPARFISSLVSNDLSLGFLVVNAALIAFGVLCWAFPVRRGWPSARGFAWFWVFLELANGAGHIVLALSQGGYFPGVATAPILLFFAVWLATMLVRQGVAPAQPAPR